MCSRRDVRRQSASAKSPEVKGQQLDVAEIGPVGPNLVAGEFEAVKAAAVGGRAGREFGCDVIIAMLGSRVRKRRWSLTKSWANDHSSALHVGQRGMPAALGIDLPALDPPPAADDRPLLP